MSKPKAIDEITIKGFRSYLESQTFKFTRGQTSLSAAIFAPNAHGKSSLIDAVEFFFSPNASISRLGEKKNRSGNKEGREAIPHYNANKDDVEVGVTLFGKDSEGIYVKKNERKLADTAFLPENAKHLMESCKVPFIIRGHELRKFVEDHSALDRYNDLSQWLALEPLVNIQQNLVKLKKPLTDKFKADNTEAIRKSDLKKLTNNFLFEWDETQAISWLRTNYADKLNFTGAIEALENEDIGIKTIFSMKEKEEKRLGIDTLKSIKQLCSGVYLEDNINDEKTITGSLSDFLTDHAQYQQCLEKERSERNSSEKAIFEEVWKQSKLLLDDNTLIIVQCPICDTDFTLSKLGSKDSVKVQVSENLEKLANYSAAKKALEDAKKKLTQSYTSLKAGLNSLITSTKELDDFKDASITLKSESTVVEKWVMEQEIDGVNLSTLVQDLVKKIDHLITSANTKIDDISFQKMYEKATSLISLKQEFTLIEKRKERNQVIQESVKKYSQEIDKKIAEFIQLHIDQLKEEANKIYSKIQEHNDIIPRIILDIAQQDAANQRQVMLTCDFVNNREGVAPASYLSDSQVHTLALSMRLAAIKLYNQDAPLIVLDDIVTSYDASHRRNIAKMLAESFKDHQIIITTHDEMFFNFLRECLPQNNWLFKRIAKIDRDYGPRYEKHYITDEEIEEAWAKGNSAGNLIRKAEEDWLESICRQFGVFVRMRDTHNAFKYDRSELASALATFLKERKMIPPLIEGVSNRFLNTLQSGVIENFTSHFQNNPNTWGDIGDEKSRWSEFIQFRSMFSCSSCGKTKFRRGLTNHKPQCENSACEAVFAFKEGKEL